MVFAAAITEIVFPKQKTTVSDIEEKTTKMVAKKI